MGGADSECVILDPWNYEAEIKQIAIPRERARHRNGALTEEEAIFRSVSGKLMRVARTARPCAIYDDSAAAQTFHEGDDRFGGRK